MAADRWLNRFTLAPADLLRDATYRRLWTSILISSFGGQVTLLALPLTAAVLMHAAPTQMGLLTAMVLAWRRPVIRSITILPTLKGEAVTPYSSD